jgi:hypothetical protein
MIAMQTTMKTAPIRMVLLRYKFRHPEVLGAKRRASKGAWSWSDRADRAGVIRLRAAQPP